MREGEEAAAAALRDLARANDRFAQTRGTALSREDAARAWQALIDGTLSVIDHFDSDGRRFLVARLNEKGAEGGTRLGTRERAVVTRVTRGYPNRQIATELEIRESSVSTALRSATKKLGLRSRLELVWMFARVDRPIPDEGRE